MYSTASRLRPAAAAVGHRCSAAMVMVPVHHFQPVVAQLAATRRSYATGSKNFTDVFANNWDKFKSMVTRRKQREEMLKQEQDEASPAKDGEAATPASLSSDEAAVRKARENAKVAAQERAKARAEAKKATEGAQPPRMSVDEAIRAVLMAEGIAADKENRVVLDDLSLKGKLVAVLVSEAHVHLSHADLTQARNVGELRALAKAAGKLEPAIKHPVAAWFTQQQEAGQLPPNVQFVAYSKKDKLKLKELY